MKLTSYRIWLTVLCIASCARAPLHPAAPPASKSPPGLGWIEYELPATGVYAGFPAIPEESVDWTKGDPRFRYRTLSFIFNGQTYYVSELEVGSRAGNAAILAASTSFVKNVTRKEDVRLGPFRGVEIVGETAKHESILLRTFVVGGSLVMAGASVPKPPLDLPSASRFLDSVRLEMPWRVEPIVALGISTALPAKVFPVEGKGEQGRLFVLGGVDAVAYYLSVVPVAPALQGSPDDVLDRAVQAYGNASEVTFDAPVELDGVRGRDVLTKVGSEYTRIRAYVHGDRLYQVLISSTSKRQCMNDDAKRFLDSLRWFD